MVIAAPEWPPLYQRPAGAARLDANAIGAFADGTMMPAMDQVTPRAETQRFRLAQACEAPLAISLAASVALMSGAWMLYPVLPVLADNLGVDESRIGLVMVAYTAPAIVLAPLFGIIADLHGRRWMLILGLALFALAGGAVALAP